MKLGNEEKQKVDEVGIHGGDGEMLRNSDALDHSGHAVARGTRRVFSSRLDSPLLFTFLNGLTDWFRNRVWDPIAICKVREWYVTGISRSPVVDTFCSYWLLGLARPIFKVQPIFLAFKPCIFLPWNPCGCVVMK